jgi:hypothetical protein
MEQAVDQHLAPRQLEARQFDGEPAADLSYHELDAAAEEPAHAGHQQHHQHGPACQSGEDHEGPQWQGDRLTHRIGFPLGRWRDHSSELSDDIRGL